MKKNFRKFFAVLLAVAMLAAQIAVPVFAVEQDGYCSSCKEYGKYDDAQVDARTVVTCNATYKVYDCINPDTNPDANVTTPCTGSVTIKISDVGTGDHKAKGDVHEANEPTCTEDGNVAWQTCSVCSSVLNVPGEGETLAVLATVVIPATGHSVTYVAPDAADCTEPGTYGYWKCEDCDAIFAESAATPTDPTTTLNPNAPTIDSVVEPTIPHNYQDVAEKLANCRDSGYSAHRACTVCGAIDPATTKTIYPVQDHGFHLEYTIAPTCTVDGKNHFQCNDQTGTCPYSAAEGGADEILPMLKHSFTTVDAVEPSCETKGNIEHKVCTRTTCGLLFATTATDVEDLANAYAPNALVANGGVEIAALGHNTVSVNFREATCTETGVVDAFVCDRCGKIHYAGDVSPATGHTLTPVAPVQVKCTTDGLIEHYYCSECEGTFAKPEAGWPLTGAGNIDAVPVDPVIEALGHDFEESVDPATCDGVGYKIFTCKRDCREAGYAYSEEIPATGHKYHLVDEVPASCQGAGTVGKMAHYTCENNCGNKFILDGENYVQKTDTELEIAIPSHDSVEVPFKAPTYNEAGNEAGTKCSVCGDPLVAAQTIPELSESIKFIYEFDGVNGANSAVNSGYLQVKVAFEVLEDDLSNVPAELRDQVVAEAIANIFGIDFKFAFDNDVFTLTHVVVAEGIFNEAYFTNLETANSNGYVKLNQNMGSDDYAAFTAGEAIPFATLTFQVADVLPQGKEFTNTVTPFAGYVFGFDGAANVIHKEYETDNTEIIGVTGDTNVTVPLYRLGDANKDGEFTNADVIMLRNFLKNRVDASAYNTIYDLDKDGFVTVGDLALLSNAVVENNTYLDIDVCPYGTCYTVVE